MIKDIQQIPALFFCDCCGGEIYEGTDYYECSNGENYCEYCISHKIAEPYEDCGMDDGEE